MIFVYPFRVSSLILSEILSVIPNCRNHVIDFNRNKFWFQRMIHTLKFSVSDNSEPQFSLQDYGSLLRHLGDLRDINYGQSLHSILIKNGLDRDVFIQNNILRFYAICHDLMNARLVFDEMPDPNLVSWTSMISSYVQHGFNDLGLQLFYRMFHSGLRPNEFGFSVALKACRITDDARRFFDGIPVWGKSEALWNTLLDSYVQAADAEEAVELFRQMLQFNILPTCFSYTIMIKLCADLLNVYLGRSLHGSIIKVGFETHGFVGGALVDAYSKLGALHDASKVFCSLEEKDNVVWSTLLTGYHKIGDAEQGLTLYLEYVSKGYELDPFTFTSAFNLCSILDSARVGSQIHCSFIKSGFLLDSFVGNAVINMYVSAGMTSDAYKALLEVRDKNEICFNAMIAGFIFNSEDIKALELFSEMKEIGLIPDHSTISYTIRACANLNMLEEGKALHSHILKTLGNPGSNLCTGNAFIEMYSKFGGVEEAKMAFEELDMPNEFSWTTVILSYTELERYREALQLFHDMLLSPAPVEPSQFTLVVVIQACRRLAAPDQGRQLHAYIIKAGYEAHAFVGSALIGMYATSPSDIYDASRVFSYMPEQDLVSWSTIITAWAQHGHGEEALRLFLEFPHGTIPVDESILSSCLSACASLAALKSGKWVHSHIIKSGFESHIHVGSSVIDMYCKCGSIEDAQKFFDGMEKHNVVSWTAMISGYAHHGLSEEALVLFHRMTEVGLKPDGITFIGVLTACSHVGLVKEGLQYFESIQNDYGLNVTINHFACVVDLLGRAGELDKAEALINTAPFPSKNLLWRTLLGACNKHGNIHVGNRIAELLVKLEPDEPSTYVSLSNIYASSFMWDHFVEVRNRIKEENINKHPGCSWVEIAS
ncbi:pentatricopeptide repeat-containing protein At3g09040, mitochondrial-like isoform X3 [Telopea speciosissima]|uniref:pentatricopeptide repeat-containing protein At3g09040, mitochondrial-like isoform X3 n=1 Tax=Telopea speciosissima TaxID=54955 RepID=UPI001CC544D8|nr:pentatricopeptide repeat-containing protein At3g09040, mitochondrial-like isoform X3 [Telopea speciosissima]